MAVTFGAIGTGSNGSITCTPAYPTGITSASKLYCFVASGASGEPTPTMPAGWTLLGSFSGGSGATFGLDVGNRRVSVFKKDTVTGTESGTETVSLASGNTMRAHIVRMVHGASTTIKEHWVAGADSSHGLSWSATAAAGLPWKVGGLLCVITAQCIDASTQSAQAVSATGITFGTLTNRASTPVTTGSDHRYVLDTVPVSAVVEGSAGAPTWTHTNSADASGATGFLLLEEQTAGIAAATFARGASTGEPLVGVPRTVQRYSRMGLVRGAPARKLGAFQFGAPTTNVAGQAKPRGVTTGSKSIAGAVAGTLAARGATSGFSLAGSNVSGLVCPRASVTAEKFDLGRTVGNYSRMGLLRGSPARLYGTFQRLLPVHETDIVGRVDWSSAGASLKRTTYDQAGRLFDAGAVGFTKIGHAAVAGRTGQPATDAPIKTGHAAVAGFGEFRGFATYTLTGGRTVARFSALSLYLVPGDRYGSFARTPGAHVYGATNVRAATVEIKIGEAELAGATFARGADTAAKIIAAGQLSASFARAAGSFVHIGHGAESARIEFRGATTTLQISGPTYDQRSYFNPAGSVTHGKTIEEDALGFIRPLGATSAEKDAGTAASGLLQFRGATTYGGPRQTDLGALFLAYGSASGQRVLSGIAFGAVAFRGAVTHARTGITTPAARADFRGASGAQKETQTDVSGALFTRGTGGYSLAFVPIGGGRRRIGVGSTAAAGGTIGSTAAGVGNKRIGSERG